MHTSVNHSDEKYNYIIPGDWSADGKTVLLEAQLDYVPLLSNFIFENGLLSARCGYVVKIHVNADDGIATLSVTGANHYVHIVYKCTIFGNLVIMGEIIERHIPTCDLIYENKKLVSYCTNDGRKFTNFITIGNRRIPTVCINRVTMVTTKYELNDDGLFIVTTGVPVSTHVPGEFTVR